MATDLKDIVRRIREQADLLDIVSRQVTLKRISGRYWGCCPFHAENTASFSVRPEAGHFHCFGCGTGGDVITFIMRTENLSFIETIRKLAGELRIELPNMRNVPIEERDAEEKLRKDIENANNYALKFFRKVLEKRENPKANDYLPERGLAPDMIERFQLGAAPEAWSTLSDLMLKDGFSEGLLIEAGLSVKSEKGHLYDRFRHRLIFPIFDHNNRAVGFGGRALESDDRTPKYLNSAESPLYHKGRMLYALNVAGKPIQESGHAIVCEGYMDVITAHAHGFTMAVGTLGTALTPDQARLLKRFTSRVHFLYDGDSAGVKAMLRGGEALLAAGLDTRVIVLPKEDDPDTFLRREGPEPMRARVKGAQEYFDFAVAERSKEFDAKSLAGQAQLIESVVPLLRAMKSDVMREGAMTRLLQRVGGIPREAIARMVARTEQHRHEPPPPPVDDHEESPRASGAGRIDLLERGLLKLMLENEGALDFVRGHADDHCAWFEDERLLPWFMSLVHSEGPADMVVETHVLQDTLPAPREIISELVVWEAAISKDPIQDAEHLIARLEERHRLSITAQLLEELSRLPHDEMERILRVFHHESRARMDSTGKQLRLSKRRRK